MLVSLLPLLAAVASASPVIQEAMQLKHALASAPAGWQLKAQASPDAKMLLHIGMKEQNLDQLQKRLLEISHPDHADYGKHMTRDEIEALTKPTAETQESVQAWLASHGIAAEAPVNNGFIQVKLTAAQANKLLAADYGVYRNAAEGRSSLRTTSYSVPASVHSHITTIQPTTMFASLGLSPEMQHLEAAAAAETTTSKHAKRAGCTSSVTPACLKDQYNMRYSPSSASSSIGITGFLGQVASQSDLSTFLKSYGDGIPAGKGNFSVELINGGSNSGSAGVEADLDIEYTVGLTYPMKNVFLATGGAPPYDPSPDDPDNGNEPYLDLLNWLAGQDKIPQTITSSYADNELTVPPDYAKTVCDGFMKLGARGTTFIAGSGDGGVSGAQDSQCDTRDGGKAFVPTFPSTCPWITSVGGTAPGSVEKAASLSTGGFSNYFPRPDYQSKVVPAYLSTLGSQYQGMYNASGRGFPDVAAFALNYRIAYQGRLQSIGGTSAATPVFASVVALLNDYLASQGKPSLGFLNPFLYGKGVQGLKDIVGGNNPGCGTNGFSAVKGWDPITGLGTPNFGTLKTLV